MKGLVEKGKILSLSSNYNTGNQIIESGMVNYHVYKFFLTFLTQSPFLEETGLFIL
jgi:hypothetical protein